MEGSTSCSASTSTRADGDRSSTLTRREVTDSMPRSFNSAQITAKRCAKTAAVSDTSSSCGFVIEHRISNASTVDRWLRTLQSGWICRPRRIIAGMSMAHTAHSIASFSQPSFSSCSPRRWHSDTSSSSFAYVRIIASVSCQFSCVVPATACSRSPTTMRASERISGEAFSVM